MTQLTDLDAYLAGFASFIESAPSSYHAAQEVAEALVGAGFTWLEEGDSWEPGMAGAFVVRDGAVIAWRAGAGVSATSPVRVLGCHTDSPGFVLKPHPSFQAEGWAQAGVEVYGGPLVNSWLDRDLAFAGRLVLDDGSERLVHTGAIARIPQLAIHLDREQHDGVHLDRQRHLQPVVGTGEVSVLGLLADAAGVAEERVWGVDVRLADTQAPARIGAGHELFASGRLDNLSSVYAGLTALIEAEPAPDHICVFAAFDHEEIGSATRSGAKGPFLLEVLARLRASLGASAAEAGAANAASWVLSADAGHAAHPNYPEKHDPHVRPRPGGGPMLKVNADQRYATDAHGAALWRRLSDTAGVPAQVFVSNNAVPCGSTIGPFAASESGIRTVDVGVPLLSMHSVRELAHVSDLHDLARIVAAFYQQGANA